MLPKKMEARVCHRQKSLFSFKKKVLWDNRVVAFTNIYIYASIISIENLMTSCWILQCGATSLVTPKSK